MREMAGQTWITLGNVKEKGIFFILFDMLGCSLRNKLFFPFNKLINMKFDYSVYFNRNYFYYTLNLLRKARIKISLFFLADNLTEI